MSKLGIVRSTVGQRVDNDSVFDTVLQRQTYVVREFSILPGGKLNKLPKTGEASRPARLLYISTRCVVKLLKHFKFMMGLLKGV